MSRPRILVVDDSSLVRELLRRSLTAAGYDVVEAEDGAQGAVAALRDPPSVVVTDLEMPVMDGFQLARLLKHDPATAHVPVVILTSHTEASSRFWVDDAGADEYVTKDEIDDRLIPAIERVSQGNQTASEPTREAVSGPLEVLGRVARQLDQGLMEATLINRLLHIGVEKDSFSGAARAVLGLLSQLVDAEVLGLCVADDRSVRVHLHRSASSDEHDSDVEAIVAEMAGNVGAGPDEVTVVQIDGREQAMNGAGHLECAYRADLPLRNARACVAVFSRHPEQLDGLPQELLATTAPHVALVLDNARLAERLWNLSTHDGLTALLNHRTILARLTEEADRATRYKTPLSIALCDIDRFKRINDSFGHPVGDSVLLGVARRLSSGLRSTDVLGRYGGEEFLIVVPNCGIDAARTAARRLCSRLAGEAMVIGEVSVKVTASFGVASGGEIAGQSFSEGLVSLADSRLYQAKAAGRCCVKP